MLPSWASVLRVLYQKQFEVLNPNFLGFAKKYVPQEGFGNLFFNSPIFVINLLNPECYLGGVKILLWRLEIGEKSANQRMSKMEGLISYN